MIEGGIIALDLNGVPEGTFAVHRLRSVASLKNDPVIGAALEHVDILHLNEDELVLLTGCEIKGTAESQLEDDYAIASAVNLFLLCGVAVVALTRGSKGSFVSCNDTDRFRRCSMLPASWVDCTAKIGCVQLPPKTIINGNGAGDAFLGGLLVAAMLRHTGMTVPSSCDEDPSISRSGSRDLAPAAKESTDVNGSGHGKHGKKPQKTKLTPYTLYMRENYMTLKNQFKDDKKAIFSMCHEMWENEGEEVKAHYERKAQEADPADDTTQRALDDGIEALDSTPKLDAASPSRRGSSGDALRRNMYMTNRALNLESAVQFASLVAAYHIDVATRDRTHIDVSQLLDRSMVFTTGKLEEF